jgi:hypothetical protein
MAANTMAAGGGGGVSFKAGEVDQEKEMESHLPPNYDMLTTTKFYIKLR